MKQLYLLMIYNYPYGVYDHNDISKFTEFDDEEKSNCEFLPVEINKQLKH